MSEEGRALPADGVELTEAVPAAIVRLHKGFCGHARTSTTTYVTKDDFTAEVER